MLDGETIEQVNKFGEKLRDRLQDIGRSGAWGAPFELSRAGASDYYRARVVIGGETKKKNFIQLNGATYLHPSYSSPKPWKLLARFPSHPGSLLWEKKEPYQHGRRPQDWSPGGLDVWAVSYESLAEALSDRSGEDILDEILEDLRVSWAYSSGRQPPQDPGNVNNWQPGGRVDITLSIDERIWSEFRGTVAQQYRPRKNHAKRPSHAKLLDDAVDGALMLYIDQCRGPRQDEDQGSRVANNAQTVSSVEPEEVNDELR